MLEEVLNSINLNLERIAKATEDGSYLYWHQLETLGIPIEQSATENTQQDPIADVAKTQGLQNIPQPVHAQIPQEPVQVATTIPTTQVQESFTQEQLAVAMSNAVSAGKMNVIQGILQQLGVQALTQINPTDYNKVATMLKEAGVNV